MRDPHVEKLIYELNHDGTVDYKDPPPVEAEQKDFRLRLSKGRLRVEMLSHCAGIAEARDLVEPFLRTWETDAFLKSGKNHLHFEFVDSEVIDRNPPGPGEPQVFRCSSAIGAAGAGRATFIVGKNEYPKPPTYNLLSLDAETLATRYRGYRDDKEPLLAMAYFCLTVVEYRANKRKEAAKQYNLDFRYGLYFSEAIGYIIRVDGSRTPLYYGEIKLIKATGEYHVIPRTGPRRTS